jgi:CheY-like chemotaxis protein
VDGSRITQVFWNLLQNACKFTPIGGSIDVRVYNEHGHLPSPDAASVNGESDKPTELVVEVSDTGMGISPETLPRIFNAFEQGERSRGQGFGGLGLGLAISHAIIELHSGAITAASEGKGKGATFTVRLDCVKPATKTTETDREPRAVAGTAAVTRSMRVLVVEDHHDTAEQFARLLKRAGHDVKCAGTIKEAQTFALATSDKNQRCAFDILISDLDLPDGSGLELMRNLAQRCPIRGIAISGHGMKEDIDASNQAGFSYHMTKPVNWSELKVVIDQLAEKAAEKL